jgi:integrase
MSFSHSPLQASVIISSLIVAAGRLRPNGGPRWLTYATFIALLAATGLRISEALKLTFANITSDGLLIRETKWRKTDAGAAHCCRDTPTLLIITLHAEQTERLTHSAYKPRLAPISFVA